MLRKLASTAPAIGNVQDRLERLHDLQPRIQSALDDAHQLLKNRKDIYKPQEEGDEECEDDKPKRKSCKAKKAVEGDSCCCDNTCSSQCNSCPIPAPAVVPTLCCCDNSCGNQCGNCPAPIPYPIPAAIVPTTCCCDNSCGNPCGNCQAPVVFPPVATPSFCCCDGSCGNPCGNCPAPVFQ